MKEALDDIKKAFFELDGVALHRVTRRTQKFSNFGLFDQRLVEMELNNAIDKGHYPLAGYFALALAHYDSALAMNKFRAMENHSSHCTFLYAVLLSWQENDETIEVMKRAAGKGHLHARLSVMKRSNSNHLLNRMKIRIAALKILYADQSDERLKLWL